MVKRAAVVRLMQVRFLSSTLENVNDKRHISWRNTHVRGVPETIGVIWVIGA